MINRTIYPTILFAVLLAFLFSSCQNNVTLQSISPELLKGSWKVNGAPDEYKTVYFLEGQEFRVDQDGDGEADVLGYYKLDGEKIIFIDFGGIIVPACHREGVYFPELRGNKLSFQLIRDECPGRLKAMKRTWRKIVS